MLGTFLMIQWWWDFSDDLVPSNVGNTGTIPGQGTKVPYAMGQLSLCAGEKWCTTMIDLVGHN